MDFVRAPVEVAMQKCYTEIIQNGGDDPENLIWSLAPGTKTIITPLGKVFGKPIAKPAMLFVSRCVTGCFAKGVSP